MIVLGCIRNLGADLIPHLMQEFQQTPQGQNVTFQLHTGSSFSSILLEHAENGDYDMVFTSHAGVPTQMDFFPFHSLLLSSQCPLIIHWHKWTL